MRHVREMVEATTAEAKSVCGEVESRVAILAVAADESAACAVKEISSRVKEVAKYPVCAGVAHHCGCYPATGKGIRSGYDEHRHDG